MKCLIDADVLLHEIGWSGEFKDKETGEEILFDFDKVADLLDNKIEAIKEGAWADEPPTLYISSSEEVVNIWNSYAKWRGLELLEHKPNFRYDLAVTKPYKGNRKNPKPFHFYNIVAYMIDNYDVVISQDGFEADDEICMAQKQAIKNGLITVICSRDKDLRICEGNHYSWECGKQKAIGPVCVDSLGYLQKTDSGDVIGYGLSFFLYQMLVGDAADNIPGLTGVGKAAAWKLLEPLQGDGEAQIKAVKDLYKEKLGPDALEYFKEQGSLLWMRLKRDEPFDVKKLRWEKEL